MTFCGIGEGDMESFLLEFGLSVSRTISMRLMWIDGLDSTHLNLLPHLQAFPQSVSVFIHQLVNEYFEGIICT